MAALDRLPEWTIVAAAVLTAIGVIWHRVGIPARDFFRHLREWMARIETAVTWTEEQMMTNGGSSLVDKVDTLIHNDAERAQRVARLLSDSAEQARRVDLLLRHDADRDRDGKRYGSAGADED